MYNFISLAGSTSFYPPYLVHAGMGTEVATGFAGGVLRGPSGLPDPRGVSYPNAVLAPPPDMLPSDPLQPQQDSWLSLVDKLNVKAFVSLTLAPSVRHGVRQLLFTSGLGEWHLGWVWVRVHLAAPAG